MEGKIQLSLVEDHLPFVSSQREGEEWNTLFALFEELTLVSNQPRQTKRVFYSFCSLLPINTNFKELRYFKWF